MDENSGLPQFQKQKLRGPFTFYVSRKLFGIFRTLSSKVVYEELRNVLSFAGVLNLKHPSRAFSGALVTREFAAFSGPS